jgi:L-rhamnose isomerase
VGSLKRRLGAAEMMFLKVLILDALLRAEIQEMLKVLEASEAIEDSLYEKVVGILTRARYIEGGA